MRKVVFCADCDGKYDWSVQLSRDSLLERHREIHCKVGLLEEVVAVWELGENFCGEGRVQLGSPE
jgi:hypothetical protein